MSLVAGMNGGARGGAAAMALNGRVVGVCAQERVTRVKGDGSSNGLPDEALDLVLMRAGRDREHVNRYLLADSDLRTLGGTPVVHVGHHAAHASTAYFSSPFDSAAVLICDHEPPFVSVWKGQEEALRPVEWPWSGGGFAGAFSRVAAALGFAGPAADQRLEALARLEPDARHAGVDRLFGLGDGGLDIASDLEVRLESWCAGLRRGSAPHARLAAAAQARLGEILVELLRKVRTQSGCHRLCLGGSFFFHSSMNTVARSSGVFPEVFVPIDPGNSGLAVGAVLSGIGGRPGLLSPFLGPSYSAEEVKETLDNCKLQYAWESEESAAMIAVRALREGRLVGWFDEGMEWGPRALGARCILANPMARYVLENLNLFLKRRELWRGYALSGLLEAVRAHFEGPDRAPFMECDYRAKDVARFREALPSPEAAVRVHTVSTGGGLPRFRRLLEAFGETTGLPFLINTSFNGFHEPIVCSPRDAVRVFYGTGLDVLVINQFVLRK